MKTMKFLVVTLLFAGASVAQADCEITVTREACPGQETKALKPYNNEKTTKEKAKATDEASCKKAIEAAGKIVRKGVLASKSAEGTWDGKKIGEAKDKQSCN